MRPYTEVGIGDFLLVPLRSGMLSYPAPKDSNVGNCWARQLVVEPPGGKGPLLAHRLPGASGNGFTSGAGGALQFLL